MLISTTEPANDREQRLQEYTLQCGSSVGIFF